MAVQNIVQIQAARKRQDRLRTQKAQTVGEWQRGADARRAVVAEAMRDYADWLQDRPRCLTSPHSIVHDRQFVMVADALGGERRGGA